MRHFVGLTLAIAILALAAALALPILDADRPQVGEYQLVPDGADRAYRIDTVTGEAWISVDGGDWEPIEEADDSGPDQTTAAARTGSPSRAAHRIGRPAAAPGHRARQARECPTAS